VGTSVLLSKTLIEAREKAAQNKDFSNVEDIVGYIKNRRTKLKDKINNTERKKLNSYISAKIQRTNITNENGIMKYRTIPLYTFLRFSKNDLIF